MTDKENVAGRANGFSRSLPEARRYARCRAELPITATVLAQNGYKSFQGRCSEIAEAGLGAIISTELAVGEIVSLEISLPSPYQHLKLRSVLRRRKGLFHGFEFLELQPEQRDVILSFCPRTEAVSVSLMIEN